MSCSRRLICAISLAVAMGFTGSANAQDLTKIPPVPAAIQVPADNVAFLKAHAIGTQNYTCLKSGASYAWKGMPQATLFVYLKWMNTDIPLQAATHFLSPNPSEDGLARPTWQSSDSSAVWGSAIASSNDPAFVSPDSIPWLLLQVVGTQKGPAGGSTLVPATYIQRINTSGGLAPSEVCSADENAGVIRFVSYAADYVFYRANAKR